MTGRLRTTGGLPVRGRNAEVARVFMITPPLDDNDDNEQSATNILHGRCFLKAHEEICEIRERLDVVEKAGNEELLRRARSISHDRTSCADVHDEIHDLTGEIQGVKDKVDKIDNHLGNIGDNVAGIESNLEDKFNYLVSQLDSAEVELTKQIDGLEEKLNAVEKRLDAVEERLDAVEKRLDAVEERLDAVDGSLGNLGMIIRNGLASRMHDMVTPLRVFRHDADGNLETWTEPQRSVRWYWKLHYGDRHEELLRQHRLYGINWKLWSEREYDDSEEEDDSEDLDRGAGNPTTLENAVIRFRKRAAMALFGHLGLPYQRFEDIVVRDERNQQIRTARKRSNEAEEQLPRQRSHNDSWYGSPTEAIVSSTESGIR